MRDGRACDFLGEGRPTERLVPQPEAAASIEPSRAYADGGLSPWWVAAVAAVALLAIGGYVVRRAR